MKPRWQVELEEGARQLEAEVSRRRTMSVTDPVADGISYAVSEFRARMGTLLAPGRELTPAQWGAEQDPPVVEQTVRNWMKHGEIEYREGPRGALILATAVRQKRLRERGRRAP